MSVVSEFTKGLQNPHATPVDGGLGASTSQPATAALQAHKNHRHVNSSDRVRAACVECQQRKIRCDGQIPCRNCAVSFRDCTYSERTKKRKRRAPTFEQMSALENRLKTMENYMTTVLPPPSTDTRTFDSGAPTKSASLESKSAADRSTGHIQSFEDRVDKAKTRHGVKHSENGFHGHSSEFAFLERMRDKLGDGIDLSKSSRATAVQDPMPQLFDPAPSLIEPANLPSREEARRLVDVALDAFPLMCVTHRPTFENHLNLIYALDPKDYGPKESQFLPLLFSVMAVGSLFAHIYKNGNRRKQATAQGMKYFWASRHLIKLAYIRDLSTLQAVFFLILFLSSTVRVSTCYPYTTFALSSALQIGLHHSMSTNEDLIERETGRRLFWAVRLMNDYFSVFIGLPKLLHDDDIDQDMPVELDDICIERSRLLPQPVGKISVISGANAYARLHKILASILKHIYPMKGMSRDRRKNLMSCTVSTSKVKELEEQLHEWHKTLPTALRTENKATGTLLRTQYGLSAFYAFVRVMLYRPFLHYMTSSADEQAADQNFSGYVTLCIRACRQIVHLNAELLDSDLTPAVNWTISHPLMSSLFTLLYVVLECPDNETASTAIEDLAVGRKVLGVLARYDYAAYRAKTVLTVLIARLPNEFKSVQEKLQAFDDDPGKVIRSRHSDVTSETLHNYKSSSMPVLNTSSSEAEKIQSNLAYHEQAPVQKQPALKNYTVASITTISGQSAPLPQIHHSTDQPESYASAASTNTPYVTQSANPILAIHSDCNIDQTANGYIEAQPFSFMPNRAIDPLGSNAIRENSVPEGLGSEDQLIQDIFSLVDTDGYGDGMFGYEQLF